MPDVVSCPSCGAQYLAGAAACADCGAPLLAGLRLEPGAEEVGYDLGDWGDDERLALAAGLAEAGVPSRWEGPELVVRPEDADAVELLVEEIDQGDLVAASAADADGGAELLSKLYVAADVLQHDGKDAAAVLDLLDAADQTEALGPPYGLEPDVWRDLVLRIDAVADLLGAEADDEAVAAAARELREALRPLV